MSAAVVLTVLTKLLGLAVLFGTGTLLYALATSPIFRVQNVSVSGNRLLTAEEIEATAGMGGTSMFWVRGSEIAQRVQRLAAIKAVTSTLLLPDLLLLNVIEREPAVIWIRGEAPYLVDREGLVIAVGSRNHSLMTIRDTNTQALAPGDRVAADVVRRLSNVDTLLGSVLGSAQRSYEYSPDVGLNVVSPGMPRLVLGNGEEIEWKVGAIQSIVRHLQATRARAELIDVRVLDRPFYR